MTITLTPELEKAIEERAQREGTTPENVALQGLRSLFVANHHTPEEILSLAAQVYAGLSENDRDDVEKIATGRTPFFGERSIQ
ncbi:hypothetical protein CCAX7_64250 [Capsulimonas corticalis]|uniref:Uncharacterized protein n=1 Tax=Capsulimonas corticalis TaxID=2219043 RepID=A0A402CQP1_9BACT|nr:hypothetical protein [Capsulimonas corticalis]BDI34374.1 hypothetical protein CCAX7_64250 [Capsulimonas corticalis]